MKVVYLCFNIPGCGYADWRAPTSVCGAMITQFLRSGSGLSLDTLVSASVVWVYPQLGSGLSHGCSQADLKIPCFSEVLLISFEVLFYLVLFWFCRLEIQGHVPPLPQQKGTTESVPLSFCQCKKDLPSCPHPLVPCVLHTTTGTMEAILLYLISFSHQPALH